MNYRKDIQILRGLSVLLVVLFHLNIGIFNSGYLGVDVFFVISGFLMAVLYDENRKLQFYTRRALRLLPAYFTTIIITVLASIFIVIPNEYNQVFRQSLFADLFASNIGFWMEKSYFSKAEFNPLLHLWSLGVEIQFYLIIPILVFFLNIRRYFFIVLLAGSLVLCFFITGVSPKTSFYMMPLRLWEFLIGFGVANYFTNMGTIHKNSYSWIGNIGLLIILAVPIMNVDGKSYSFINGHPGLYALLVTLATGATLSFGISSYIEKSKIATILEVLGKYSYSIYLVHFPVIVLFLYEPFSGTNLKPDTIYETIILIIIIMILSPIMYHLVEVASRKLNQIKTLLFLSPLIIIFTSFTGLEIQKKLFTERELIISNAFQDRDTYRCGKISRIINPSSISCKITKFSEKPEQSILFVGNSHADSLKQAFAEVANVLKTDIYFIVENEPLMKKGKINSEKIVQEALKNKVKSIVLHYSRNSIEASTIKKLANLAGNNDISVSFIMPVPKWKEHIPEALWNKIRLDKNLPLKNNEDYDKDNNEFYNALLTLEEKNSEPSKFKIYSVKEYFCQPQCAITDDLGKPLYFDSGHLTLTGSRYLKDLFKEITLRNLQ